jgi:NADH-quinone oxidoreductase subunit M
MCVGVIYDKFRTKKIADLGGIALSMPNFAMFAMIFTLASVGLPGTSGFVGEFLTIIASFKVNKAIGLISGLGVILGAIYMLWLYKRVWFSDSVNDDIKKAKDIEFVDLISFSIMAILVIILGIFPNLIIKYFTNSSAEIVKIFVSQ